jgi:putative aldouronate transport system permease protein
MQTNRKFQYSRSDNFFTVLNYCFLALMSFLCLYPVLYVVFASFSDNNRLTQHSGLLLKPLGVSFAAYEKVFKNPMILLGYRNTVFLLIVGVGLSLLMTALGAYFLSRKGVLLKKPIMVLITFTMFFSGGMIPFYLNLRELHLTNTLWGLIIPFSINTYNLIIMRTSFAAIPESLMEAAIIDGADHMRILFMLVLPLSKAILAVMVLYYGVGAGDQESVAATIKYATIIIATVPVLCIYPFLQKYFARGVMIGAVKE